MQDNVHSGHRQRMRRKLLEFSHRVFDTYELVEMLLYYTNARRDTNPPSKALLRSFGSLDGVLNATEEELLRTEGIGAATARLIRQTAAVCDALRAATETKFSRGAPLSSYAVAELCRDECARTVMISLDNAGRPIATDTLFNLDFSSGGIKPSAFVSRAVERGAAAVAVAHSHPFGPALPTDGDLQSAKLVSEALASVGITLCANYVITGNACYDTLTNRAEILNGEDGNTYPSKDGELSLAMGTLFDLLGEDADAELLKIKRACGSLFSAMLSDMRMLSSVCSVSLQALLALLPALASRRITDRFQTGRCYGEGELSELLIGQLSYSSREQVIALAMGDGGRLLSCEMLCEGTVNASEILPRLILDFARRHRVAGIILAHNHPMGLAEASDEDIIATRRLAAALEYSGTHLISHFVIAEGVASKINF